MSPLVIHSDTIAKWLSLVVTPNSGSTFGWWRLFHIIASLQNIYAIAVSSSLRTFGKLLVVTHTGNLIEVAFQVYSQNLDCDLATLMFAHPHVGVSTAAQGVFRPVIAKWDLQ